MAAILPSSKEVSYCISGLYRSLECRATSLSVSYCTSGLFRSLECRATSLSVSCLSRVGLNYAHIGYRAMNHVVTRMCAYHDE